MRKIIYFVAGVILVSSIISVMSWDFLTETQEQPLQTDIKSIQDVKAVMAGAWAASGFVKAPPFEPNFDFFMSKINQGYTEACLQEYIDEQMYRSCFLTDE